MGRILFCHPNFLHISEFIVYMKIPPRVMISKKPWAMLERDDVWPKRHHLSFSHISVIHTLEIKLEGVWKKQ